MVLRGGLLRDDHDRAQKMRRRPGRGVFKNFLVSLGCCCGITTLQSSSSCSFVSAMPGRAARGRGRAALKLPKSTGQPQPQRCREQERAEAQAAAGGDIRPGEPPASWSGGSAASPSASGVVLRKPTSEEQAPGAVKLSESNGNALALALALKIPPWKIKDATQEQVLKMQEAFLILQEQEKEKEEQRRRLRLFAGPNERSSSTPRAPHANKRPSTTRPSKPSTAGAAASPTAGEGPPTSVAFLPRRSTRNGGTGTSKPKASAKPSPFRSAIATRSPASEESPHATGGSAGEALRSRDRVGHASKQLQSLKSFLGKRHGEQQVPVPPQAQPPRVHVEEGHQSFTQPKMAQGQGVARDKKPHAAGRSHEQHRSGEGLLGLWGSPSSSSQDRWVPPNPSAHLLQRQQGQPRQEDSTGIEDNGIRRELLKEDGSAAVGVVHCGDGSNSVCESGGTSEHENFMSNFTVACDLLAARNILARMQAQGELATPPPERGGPAGAVPVRGHQTSLSWSELYQPGRILAMEACANHEVAEPEPEPARTIGVPNQWLRRCRTTEREQTVSSQAGESLPGAVLPSGSAPPDAAMGPGGAEDSPTRNQAGDHDSLTSELVQLHQSLLILSKMTKPPYSRSQRLPSQQVSLGIDECSKRCQEGTTRSESEVVEMPEHKLMVPKHSHDSLLRPPPPRPGLQKCSGVRPSQQEGTDFEDVRHQHQPRMNYAGPPLTSSRGPVLETPGPPAAAGFPGVGSFSWCSSRAGVPAFDAGSHPASVDPFADVPYPAASHRPEEYLFMQQLHDLSRPAGKGTDPTLPSTVPLCLDVLLNRQRGAMPCPTGCRPQPEQLDAVAHATGSPSASHFNGFAGSSTQSATRCADMYPTCDQLVPHDYGWWNRSPSSGGEAPISANSRARHRREDNPLVRAAAAARTAHSGEEILHRASGGPPAPAARNDPPALQNGYENYNHKPFCPPDSFDSREFVAWMAARKQDLTSHCGHNYQVDPTGAWPAAHHVGRAPSQQAYFAGEEEEQTPPAGGEALRFAEAELVRKDDPGSGSKEHADALLRKMLAEGELSDYEKRILDAKVQRMTPDEDEQAEGDPGVVNGPRSSSETEGPGQVKNSSAPQAAGLVLTKPPPREQYYCWCDPNNEVDVMGAEICEDFLKSQSEGPPLFPVDSDEDDWVPVS